MKTRYTIRDRNWILVALIFFSLNTYSQCLDGGNGHALILEPDGSVWTVGRNNFGQLGIGSFENSSIPIRVPGLPGIKTMSRGYDHSLAVDSSGALWAWGRNDYGQCSQSADHLNKPHRLHTGDRFLAIEGGHLHSVGLRMDSTVLTWGHNYFAELGNGTKEHTKTPQSVRTETGALLDEIIDVVSVGYHTLALNTHGEIYSWGGNAFGELGHRENEEQVHARKIEGLPNIKQVAVGWHHSIALDEKGNVWRWGSEPSTQIKESTPDKIDGIERMVDLPPIQKIACGSWHTLAVDSTGHVWGWGRNHFGMLATGDTVSHKDPVQIPGLENIQDIGAGCFQSIARNEAGELFTFGDNPTGQLGTDEIGRAFEPIPIALHAGRARIGPDLDVGSYNLEKILYVTLAMSVMLNFYLYLRQGKS